MAVLEKIFAGARERKARVVFPERDEPRVAEAVDRMTRDGLVEPVDLGEPTQVHLEALVEARGMKEAIAKRMLQKPLIRAAAMVAVGDADLMVAGAEAPTRRVIEAAAIAIGLQDGVSTPSSFFLMAFPDGRDMLWADCAVNVSPDAAQLAEIAQTTARSAEALLGEARPALLSFSTGTSGTGESVDMVREAAALCGFAGPVQADAALNAAIAERKGLSGAGNANVLVFPDLNSGNIAYKLAQELAGAQAIGPMLQGFRRPVCDLSRGASPDDIVASTLISVAMG